MLLVSSLIGIWACLTGVTIVKSTDIRLSGGRSPNQGRIEIRKDGVWGTYCGDSLDVQVAMVICQQVGFPGAAFAFQSSEEFGVGSGPVYYDGYMSCGGTEKTIDGCYFKDYTVHNCTHNKDAGVICIEPGYEGCFQVGTHFKDLIPKSSHLRSVDGCLKLCRNSNISYALISRTACFCIDRRPSAVNDSLRMDDECDVTCAGNARQKCGSAKDFSIYSSTEGFCNKLTPPEHGSIDTSKTRYGTTVMFSCSPGFEITGAKKLQCLRSETHPSELKWNSVTPTCTVTTPVSPHPVDNNAGLASGIVFGIIFVVVVMTVLFVYCRRRSKLNDHKPLTMQSSWSHKNHHAGSEPHMYELAGQSRPSIHSTPDHYAATPGDASNHEYVDYHEFQEILSQVGGANCDTTPLHSRDGSSTSKFTSQKGRPLPAGGEKEVGSTIMIENELYNPSRVEPRPETSRMSRLASGGYEVSDEIQNPGVPGLVPGGGSLHRPLQSRSGKSVAFPLGIPRQVEHIYEAEPARRSVGATGGGRDPLYCTADYAEVDARDSGVGTFNILTRMRSRKDADGDCGEMVINNLYISADDHAVQPREDDDVDKPMMVENILYQSQS